MVASSDVFIVFSLFSNAPAHLTAYSLRFAALRSGFRQQVQRPVLGAVPRPQATAHVPTIAAEDHPTARSHG